MAPDLLFYPALNEAEALAGVSHREVVDPSAQHRVDQIDHPIHGLGSVAAEHTLELPQQCRSLLELRRAVRTPDAPLTADAAEVASRPVGFHHQPLSEPSVTLSRHWAPIRQTYRSCQFANERKDARFAGITFAGIGSRGSCGL